MYYKQGGPDGPDPPRFIAIRGCSKLEGYHPTLAETVSCGNNHSPELADDLVLYDNYLYNVDRGIKNRGDADFGTYHLWELEEIRDICAEKGWPVDFPADKLPAGLPDIDDIEERFGARFEPPAHDVAAAQEQERVWGVNSGGYDMRFDDGEEDEEEGSQDFADDARGSGYHSDEDTGKRQRNEQGFASLIWCVCHHTNA